MVMVVNETMLGPLGPAIQNTVGILKVAFGGIFGIYLVLLALRVLEYRRMINLLKGMKEEISRLNDNLNKKRKKR